MNKNLKKQTRIHVWWITDKTPKVFQYQDEEFSESAAIFLQQRDEIKRFRRTRDAESAIQFLGKPYYKWQRRKGTSIITPQ